MNIEKPLNEMWIWVAVCGKDTFHRGYNATTVRTVAALTHCRVYDHYLIAGCVRWWCSTLSAVSDYSSVNMSSPCRRSQSQVSGHLSSCGIMIQRLGLLLMIRQTTHSSTNRTSVSSADVSLYVNIYFIERRCTIRTFHTRDFSYALQEREDYDSLLVE